MGVSRIVHLGSLIYAWRFNNEMGGNVLRVARNKLIDEHKLTKHFMTENMETKK